MNRSFVILGLLAFLAAGCGTTYYRNSADKAAAEVIRQKAPMVPNMDPAISIQEEELRSLDDLPQVTQPDEFFGAETNSEVGCRVINLDKALDLAVNHNRDYLSRKERLYLAALDLTLARHRYTPIFSGGVNANYSDVAVDVNGMVEREGRFTSTGNNLGTDALLRTGARLSADLTADFLNFVISGPGAARNSRLAATLSQPLLRGAGYKVAMENLTQAERSTLYEMRDFVQYRRQFSVRIASSYYAVLLSRDRARNAWRKLQSSQKNAERTRAFVKVGKQKVSELGRLSQQELSSQSSWIGSVRSYRQVLDSFKLELGLPLDARVVLDERNLSALQVDHPTVVIDEALRIALANRLDLYTARERHEDAERKVHVAANNLLPRLDFVTTASVGTGNVEGEFRPVDFDWKRYQWSAGLNIDLPLDRVAERNAYMSSVISLQSSLRARALSEDTVKREITEDWRGLDQAKRDYDINVIGVRLNELRVEEEELKTRLGRGTAQNLVDAQNDLTDSRNALTAALVAHTINRLNFWRDMGILMIGDGGRWEEVKNVETPNSP